MTLLTDLGHLGGRGAGGVAVVLLLLASVGTASADPAWALWAMQTQDGKAEVLARYADEAACEQARQDEMRVAELVLSRPIGGMIGKTFSLRCLPDTLTSVGTATAACAWVLWAAIQSEFVPLAGFDDRASCEAKQREVKSRGTAICLPDTVDPRGRKK